MSALVDIISALVDIISALEGYHECIRGCSVR